jgi:hypothetical protein
MTFEFWDRICQGTPLHVFAVRALGLDAAKDEMAAYRPVDPDRRLFHAEAEDLLYAVEVHEVGFIMIRGT